jgi:hypothetical protein
MLRGLLKANKCFEEHAASIFRIEEAMQDTNMVQVASRTRPLDAGFLLGLFLNPEDEGSTFL